MLFSPVSLRILRHSSRGLLPIVLNALLEVWRHVSLMAISFSRFSSPGDARLARNARPLTVGILRPAIVLYDEAHPLGEEIGTICSADMSKRPDIIVIMGTSLKVHGIKNLVRGFANAVHDKPKDVDAVSLPVKTEPGNLLVAKNPKLVIFVNRTPPPADLAHLIDYWVEGDTDIWVQKCEADWRAARPQDWEVQSKLVGADREGKSMPLSEAKNTFQVVKGPSTATSKGKGIVSCCILTPSGPLTACHYSVSFD